MKWVLIVAGAVFVLMYIGAPLLILATFKLRGRPTLKPLSPSELPPEAYEYFVNTAAEMQACGFELADYILIPDMVPNTAAYTALWVNRARGQMATAVVIYAQAPNQKPTAKSYLEFMTKLMDGPAVLTNNSPEATAFKKTRTKDTVQISWVPEPQRLYRVHLYRESKFANPGDVRYLPAPGEELQSFAEGTLFDIERQVRLGLFRGEPNEAEYRPTFTGAFHMTWRMLPPIKHFIQHAQNDRGAAALREAEAQSITPLVSVNISHDSPYRLELLDKAI